MPMGWIATSNELLQQKWTVRSRSLIHTHTRNTFSLFLSFAWWIWFGWVGCARQIKMNKIKFSWWNWRQYEMLWPLFLSSKCVWVRLCDCVVPNEWWRWPNISICSANRTNREKRRNERIHQLNWIEFQPKIHFRCYSWLTHSISPE